MDTDGLRILVVTIVHTPLDARILRREIGALGRHGARVTYAAPWRARQVVPPEHLDTIDLPRASARRRLGAIRGARRVLREQGPRHDLIVLHDPDLLAVLPGLRGLPPVVWDVHEDTAAALTDRAWVPRWLRGALRTVVGWVERWAERRCHLILAEDRYRDRFREPHPVVHNYPEVPDVVSPPEEARVVYVGRLARSRGLHELIEVGRRLRGEVEVELIGWADPGATAELERAHAAGHVAWSGDRYVPNDQALARVEGAAAGLSLLHDEPNYRHSLPTKVVEYMARGVPVVTTPLPQARDLVDRYGCGVVVPFGDVDATVAAVRQLVGDPDRRHALGRAGHEAAREHYAWQQEGERFVATLTAWAQERR